MLTHPVAVATDVDDVAVMQDAVEECGGHDVVAEDVAPLLERLVGGEDGGGPFIAPADELEEQHGPGAGVGQVADLVHDEESRMGEDLEPMGEPPGGLGFLQGLDEVGQGAVVEAAPLLSGLEGEGDHKVALAHSRGPEEDHVLVALHEAQLMEALHLVTLDGRLEREVEVLDALDRGKSGRAHGGLEAPVAAKLDLGVEERLERFGTGEAAPVEPRPGWSPGPRGLQAS